MLTKLSNAFVKKKTKKKKKIKPIGSINCKNEIKVNNNALHSEHQYVAEHALANTMHTHTSTFHEADQLAVRAKDCAASPGTPKQSPRNHLPNVATGYARRRVFAALLLSPAFKWHHIE